MRQIQIYELPSLLISLLTVVFILLLQRTANKPGYVCLINLKSILSGYLGGSISWASDS